MATKNAIQDFSFQKPAVYKILVKGKIDRAWSERFLGLQVNVEDQQDGNIVTSLVGQINDQSALSGILNMLFDMHMTVLSVNILSELNSG